MVLCCPQDTDGTASTEINTLATERTFLFRTEPYFPEADAPALSPFDRLFRPTLSAEDD
jgi:hypothetical protein